MMVSLFRFLLVSLVFTLGMTTGGHAADFSFFKPLGYNDDDTLFAYMVITDIDLGGYSINISILDLNTNLLTNNFVFTTDFRCYDDEVLIEECSALQSRLLIVLERANLDSFGFTGQNSFTQIATNSVWQNWINQQLTFSTRVSGSMPSSLVDYVVRVESIKLIDPEPEGRYVSDPGYCSGYKLFLSEQIIYEDLISVPEVRNCPEDYSLDMILCPDQITNPSDHCIAVIRQMHWGFEGMNWDYIAYPLPKITMD